MTNSDKLIAIQDAMELQTENAGKLLRLTMALREIANKGDGMGCNPEGCDSPQIAHEALLREGLK